MRIAIVGAGAIGGYLGAKLTRAGVDVVLIARGAHLAAMRANGVRVIEGDADYVAHPACTDDLGAVGDADAVFLTVKAHSLAAMAPQLGATLGPQTTVVTGQNGIPWWYFERYEGPLAGSHLESLDPGGATARAIPTARVVGCVIWPAAETVAPGVIQHIEGTRFTLGEPDGTKSARCQALAAALIAGGLKAPISTQIRREIWLKLLGNVAFNPLSALTRATLDQITGLPETRAVARAVMAEADSVARALGVQVQLSVDQRLAGAEKVGVHKTSMLQDLETGRPLELEALVGAVVELGDRLDLDLPHLRTVYACAKLLQQTQQPQGATAGAALG
ncbi:MAG TPA: 2-dehydropantoate 2-reductase [Thermomicrobiales bacterium]|nr:2-dehydropantoate 2-reductase [Thermomicrobiales bacterium]